MLENKTFYLTKDLVDEFGMTKEMLRLYRNMGYLRYLPTSPLRYTKRFIEEFIELVNKSPELFSRENIPKYAKRR
jgi:hypothetical protein